MCTLPGMSRLFLLPLALVLASVTAHAQAASQGGTSACVLPDSVAIRGNKRVTTEKIRADAGLTPGDSLNYRVLQRTLRNLFATGAFDDVQAGCDVSGGHAVLTLTVVERPQLKGFTIKGANVISEGTLRGKVELAINRALDPAAVQTAVQRMDSMYQAKGYYLARITPVVDTTGGDAHVTFNIEEGRHLAISGVDIKGNKELKDDQIVGVMKVKPEAFWFWRKGEFDDEKFQGDLSERIPKLYEQHGLIDAQVVKDTLLVDHSNGKGMLQVTVDEGKRYKVGTMEIIGNHHFTTDELMRYFPFQTRVPTITQRVRGMFGHKDRDVGSFDQTAWDDATTAVRNAYSNEGYIYAQIRPVVERSTHDSIPVVNLRWEIDEKTPATVNRIEILGNDYTNESCIREQLVILPGDVFNQDRLIRSYQNIQNLNFFESPLPPPDTKPANDQGDVDIIFRMKEKRTGSINFGASVGQGTGVGGFIGLTQPNLFGACKSASLQWQFGQFINDFQLSYTDPSVKQSRISGTVTAYHTQSRYTIADLGQSTSSGGSLQFGFPVRGSPFTRFFVSYGGEAVKFSGGLAARDTTINQGYNFRSTLGFTLTHDNRIDLPFASAGSERSITAQFNGGPLGGTASFQRYTTELRNYTTLGTLGGDAPGSQPMKLILGLTARAGMVFGNDGPFFFSQSFSLGGTQYGEQLRGYQEFSITPEGYVGTTNSNATRSSFGNAFFTSTVELGLRFNQMLYTDVFYDAGNIWNKPSEFDPTRLFRGVGVGVAIVTPLGPLGLDYAYGLDRVDEFGNKKPGWQLHFKLGQLF
jgi:outer membrane protein insertion porin family